MTAPMTSVLIVGAGPVGLVAAAELARHGTAVRIIDRLAEPTNESRAIAVHARSLDMLARMGVAETLIDTGVKARAMEIHAGRRRLFRVPLDGVDAAYPFSLNTPQTETERVLTDHLRSLGVSVERSVELTQLHQDAESVSVTLCHLDGGADEELAVAWVIGADGARSPVRHLVGGKLVGSFVGERFLLGDVDAEHRLDPEAMYTFFSADGPVLAMPLRHGRMRVMAQIPHSPETPLNLHPSLAELQHIVDERVGGISLRRAHWLTSFELHHAQASRYRWGRVFLAGDAAHIHSPAGGQGMNTGMQDAFNLAWKLAAVIDGRAGDTLLDSYQAERFPVAEKMIEFTHRLSKGGTLTGPPQYIRNAMLKALSRVGPFPRLMAETAAEVNVCYHGSPILVHGTARGAKSVAGDHFPFVQNRKVREQLDAAWALGHTTITVPGNATTPAAGLPGRQLLVADTNIAVPGYDAVIADPQRQIAQRLGLSNGGRVVVRPDTYIGTLTALDDTATLTEYFTKIAS
jgi:2-polyprenyl-6-methoxyphenol hydroxylase-like FAD-dependent oxidoreductase